MFIKKISFTCALFNLFLAMPISSFSAFSEQDKIVFKNIFSGNLKPKIYADLLEYCDKNDTNINSCMNKLKAQPSIKTSAQNQMNYSFCCVNVSGGWGDYAYYRGQEYCIPPC